MKYNLPNHLKLNKKDKKEFRLIKERIKEMTWYEWLIIGLICGALLFLSFLI